jgi:hypothetical protein
MKPLGTYHPQSSAASPKKRARPVAAALLAASLGLLLVFAQNGGPAGLLAQEEESAVNREYRIKAAYLYQFSRYVEWPASAFSTAESAFVIGVMGQDPIITDLEQIARLKKVGDRALEIRRFSSAADVRTCNILYIPANVSAKTQAELVRGLAGRGILLVGDDAGFIDRGGCMQFAVEENTIRLAIARKAAEREGLKVSSKLLQVARVVE